MPTLMVISAILKQRKFPDTWICASQMRQSVDIKDTEAPERVSIEKAELIIAFWYLLAMDVIERTVECWSCLLTALSAIESQQEFKDTFSLAIFHAVKVVGGWDGM